MRHTRSLFLGASFICSFGFKPSPLISRQGLSSMAYATSSGSPTTFVNASVAAAIDVALMDTPGFSIDQLMELAGNYLHLLPSS
jgi:hypothetical protein